MFMERKLNSFGHIRWMRDNILVNIIMFGTTDGKSVRKTTKRIKVWTGAAWNYTIGSTSSNPQYLAADCHVLDTKGQ